MGGGVGEFCSRAQDQPHIRTAGAIYVVNRTDHIYIYKARPTKAPPPVLILKAQALAWEGFNQFIPAITVS